MSIHVYEQMSTGVLYLTKPASQYTTQELPGKLLEEGKKPVTTTIKIFL